MVTADLTTLQRKQAFREMVQYHFSAWSTGNEQEREIGIAGNACSLTMVCQLVLGIEDELPDDLLGDLRSVHLRGHPDLEEEVARGQTYAAGGRCLEKVMQRRRRAYQRTEEALRGYDDRS